MWENEGMEHFGAAINEHVKIKYLKELQVENILTADVA